jgi:MFS superfamily sulfate permease-like transporter
MDIALVGNVPAGLPNLVIPTFDIHAMRSLLLPAAAIALVSYADTIATVRSFGTKHREETSSQQELTSIGLANLSVVTVGGMPVSASGSRTVVNDGMKARSQFAQLYGAIVVAVVLLLFSTYLSYIPRFALAVIILLSAYKLFDYEELMSIWRGWRSEALLSIVTAIGVAVFGILPGIGIAVALAVGNLIRRSAFPHDAKLGVSEDGLTFRDSSRPPKTFDTPGLIIYRFDAPLFFGNANFFHERAIRLIDESDEPVRWFLLDMEAISSIDSTGAKTLKTFMLELEERKIQFATARVKGPIRDTLRKTRLGAKLSSHPKFASIGLAYSAYCKKYHITVKKDQRV